MNDRSYLHRSTNNPRINITPPLASSQMSPDSRKLLGMLWFGNLLGEKRSPSVCQPLSSTGAKPGIKTRANSMGPTTRAVIPNSNIGTHHIALSTASICRSKRIFQNETNLKNRFHSGTAKTNNYVRPNAIHNLSCTPRR